MSHTPGPWIGDTCRFGSDSPYVAVKSESMTFGYNRDRIGPGVVCIVQQGPGRFLDQAEADAKLIAAAPNLLAVCEMDHDFPDINLRNYDESDVEKLLAWSYGVIDAMRAARGIATGK